MTGLNEMNRRLRQIFLRAQANRFGPDSRPIQYLTSFVLSFRKHLHNCGVRSQMGRKRIWIIIRIVHSIGYFVIQIWD